MTKNKDKNGIFYLLPGGGQNHGENMQEALKRELREETGANAVLKDLLFIREYIGINHEFSEYDGSVHQIEYIFECELDTNIKEDNIPEPDMMQIGMQWVYIKNLKNLKIYPKILKYLIKPNGLIREKTYLGDIN